MGHHLQDDWAGLEPEQPPQQNRGLVVGVAALVVMLTIVCAAAAYFIWDQFQKRTGGGDVVVAVDTAVPEEHPTLTPVPDTAVPPTVAPTITAPPVAADTAVPPAAGTLPPVVSSNVDAVQLPAPPIIDGVLNEWDAVPSYSSAFRVFAANSWDGTDDLTAVWRLAWDSNNLYVAVEVTDDTHVQTQTGNALFKGDSVDMQFDTNRPGDFGDGLSPDDIQITLSPGNFGGLPPSAWRYQGTDSGAILDAPGGNHVLVAAQQTTSGYVIEAAIPWSDLNTTPAPGLVMGLALNANDNDSPGTAVQEVMMSHISTRTLTNPTTWGTLTLK
ncbi:MAG: hypothetical protein Kow0080_13090 [Candidatus Promineifilaceae bacterium]